MNQIPFRASVIRPPVDTVSSLSRPEDSPVEINVREMVQRACQAFEARMKQQRIESIVDVDAELRAIVSPQLTQEILAHLIEDSLNAMPEGGQLDVIAVIGSIGIEIEVSDSSFAFGGGVNQPSQLKTWQGIAARSGLQIDTMSCPQGGLARTLLLPWPNRSRAAA
ncbi:MAG: hypothetical protein P8N76_23445 [Pirellulaceae bacterium]|nr:hypothetical protein [Pirellulaceae bacterium]